MNTCLGPKKKKKEKGVCSNWQSPYVNANSIVNVSLAQEIHFFFKGSQLLNFVAHKSVVRMIRVQILVCP